MHNGSIVALYARDVGKVQTLGATSGGRKYFELKKFAVAAHSLIAFEIKGLSGAGGVSTGSIPEKKIGLRPD